MYQISDTDINRLLRAVDLLVNISGKRVKLDRRESETVRMAKLSSMKIGRKKRQQ